MGETATIATVKLRILKHSVEGLRKHSRLKIAVIAGFGVGYWCGSYFLFRGGFGFVERFLPGLGELLINRLFYLFFLATFVMLVFSNMILVYSLAYKSKEVDFLTAMPLRHATIFKWKFAETLFFSSWASVFLAGPLILAYGMDRSAPIGYYLSVPAFLFPFLLVAGGLGGSAMVVLVRFFPRRKLLAAVVLTVIAAAALFVLRKPAASSGGDILESPLPVLDQMMRFARVSRSELLPSTWLVKGMLLEAKGYPEVTPWPHDKLLGLGMLWANGLMAVLVCFFIAERMFYSGWSRSKSAAGMKSLRYGGDVIGRLSVLWRFLGTSTRAMVTKDLKIFWRDPAQWSQFVIFFGLLGVYIFNLRNMSYHTFPAFFKNTISFMNLAATALTLGTLTTRFVFPQMSLEGSRFWVVGLAPVSVKRILLEKFLLCFVCSTVIAGGLTLLSGLMLGLDSTTVAISSGAMLLMCFGLSGLSVGLGALFPNFTSDNPARIVSGFGGTLALVLSLAYITIVLAGEVVISHLNLTGQLKTPSLLLASASLGAGIVGLSILAGTLPMALGARHLRKAEF
jgi:ABC-2 type transport system permease protein